MFKIESYVTPILLSYVDKYVRDFKPADAQVSLWGGGVALHNLVLKADVLQQEVSLPFTLVSGRIHELLIQVPWTKIMSEPIVVTIDTIECVLSLNPPASADGTPPPESPSRKTQVVEAPPGYMQALVRRIVSNIALRVHHLIVKYVQDDIVLSLNVKHVAVDSAGVNWEPAFADIDPLLPVIRRLVRLDDLTLCLDRADSDGKIRYYQEPLLYRCQLNFRVSTKLVSANTRRATSLAIQLRSSKLAFGVTNDQLVLLIRLLRERTAVTEKQPPPPTKTANTARETPLHTSSSNSAEPARQESWSEWAWSWLPTWMDKEGGVEEAPVPPTPIPAYFTAYLDDISLVYKIMEVEATSRKRARSILEFSAVHAAIKSTICSPTTLRVRFGARLLTLCSHGKCHCGHVNYDTSQNLPTVYMKKTTATEEDETEWVWPEEDFSEQKIERAQVADEEYRESPVPDIVTPASLQSQNRSTIDTSETNPGLPEEPQPPPSPVQETDELWQQLAPVLFVEYTHERSPPDRFANPYDAPPQDFEYSDWVELCNVKVKLEPIELRVCMGLIHRLQAIKSALLELPPVPEQELVMRTLTVEENDALNDNLPQRRIVIEMRGLTTRVQPVDHTLHHHHHDRSSQPPLILDVDLPNATIVVNGPLYPLRVCTAACQLPEDSGPLFQAARLNVSVIVPALQFRIVSPKETQPRPCARTDLKLVMHVLLNKEYFKKREKESVEFAYSFKIRELNISGSAARLQAAFSIPMSLLTQHMSAPLKYTSLASDAIHDEEAVALDVTVEDVSVRGYVTRNINTHIMSVQSARATAIHAPNDEETKQAWIFSAPETPSTVPYLRVAVQWCSQVVGNSFDYLGLWTEPTAFAVDPLFIAFLAYSPQVKNFESFNVPAANVGKTQFFHRRRPTPPSSSGRSGRGGAELVHMRPRSLSGSEPSEKKDSKHVTVAGKPLDKVISTEKLLILYERLRHMLINVEMGLVLVYVTTSTASALDCANVHDAMERHAQANSVLAMALGRFSMHSSSAKKHLWTIIRHDGPTFVDKKENAEEEESFPWKMRLADMSCYTLEPHSHGLARGGVDVPVKGMRSQIKLTGVNPRTMLESTTTTVTLSVVTKSMRIKMPLKPDKRKSTPAEKSGEERIKYFRGGLDFKPTTLKEFVRGPSTKRKKSETPVDKEAEEEPTSHTMVGPVVSLGVHIHADTPPVVLRIDHDQVKVMASAIHCFRHIVTLLQRPPVGGPKFRSVSARGSLNVRTTNTNTSSLHRSVSEVEEARDSQSESEISEAPSELISIFEATYTLDQSSIKMKKLFWFQWVISRATLVVSTPLVKFAVDVDDIISTIDLQEHYNQIKLKLASASVKHYDRTESEDWSPGVLGGRVLEAREPTDQKEENHFLSITVTQAQISNLPASWKNELHPKMLERKASTDTMWEVYATLAPLEAVVQPTILEHIVLLVQQLSPKSFCPLQVEPEQRTSAVNWQWPFLFVTAGGLRLLVTGDDEKADSDDTFVFSIGKITMNPHPENPIYRRPINCNDPSWSSHNMVYEGRQYEILINDVCVKSAQFWQIVNEESAERIKAQENPAVKWTLPLKQTFVTPVLHSMDVSCVFAPAHYLAGVLACGPAVELNFVSDCSLEVSIEQLVLMQRIAGDMQHSLTDTSSRYTTDCALEVSIEQLVLMQRIAADMQHSLTDTSSSTALLREEIYGICPYANLISNQEHPEPSTSIFSAATYTDADTKADSGIDTGTSHSTNKSIRDVQTVKKSVSVAFASESAWTDASEHLEVFVTMGMIELSLYVADDDSPEVAALRCPSDQVTNTEGLDSPPAKEPSEEKVPAKKEGSFPRRSDVGTENGSMHSITDEQRQADIVNTALDNTKLMRARGIEGNLPLIHVTFYQPNLYYWRKKNQQILQISLFNAWVGLGLGQLEGQWHLPLLSTSKGVPDPVTDIRPALATMKVVAPIGLASAAPGGSRGTIRLDVERPVQMEVSMDRLRRLKGILGLIQDRVPTQLESSIATPPQEHVLYKFRRFMGKNTLESVTIQTSQIAVSGSAGSCGWESASLQVAAGARPERVVARALVTALLVAAGPPGDRRHVLLHPLVLGMELDATWEAWRRAEFGPGSHVPTIRASVNLDNVTMDLRPDDLATLRATLELLKTFETEEAPQAGTSGQMLYQRRKDSFMSALTGSPSFSSVEADLTDHYYKDDLRSGAFKIVSGGQLPMAYQVTVHGNAVSWRYPHPRAITRIVAFPLPGRDEEIDCVLELYSPIQHRWMSHTYFKLPVSEPREIKLYVTPPEAAFALTWRFRACSEATEQERPVEFNSFHYMPREDPFTSDTIPEYDDAAPKHLSGVTAEELSGVLRVDSYFAPRLLPRLRVACLVAGIEVNLHNSLPDLSRQATELEGYYVSRPLMRSHRVLTLLARHWCVNCHLGSRAGALLLISGKLSADVLESSTGTIEELVEEFTVRGAVSVPVDTGAWSKPRSRVRTTRVRVALHVPRVRTLHSLAKDWMDIINKNDASQDVKQETFQSYALKGALAKATEAALEGRVALWIHNSCGAALRVGQEGTDEVVPLGPGARLAYRWRCPTAPKRLRFAIVGPSADWHWSNSIPFVAGSTRVRLEEGETLSDGKAAPGGGVYMYVRIEDSGASKSMHLVGRLTLANMLRHNLLFKVRARCNVSNQWRSVCSGELPAESVGRTVICGADCDMVLKIKFYGHESGWSGDIPLKECPKENVPWLVKVPSSGDIPYTSVWCRVTRARSDSRVLATVWPLYVLHSHLPLDTDVMISTNTMGVSSTELTFEETPPLVQTAPGRGTCTHLVAPGTTSARHSLSFQYRNIECPVTREAVPLHYGVTDSSVFDKRAPVHNIDEVIQEVHEWLLRSGKNAGSTWPYSLVTKHYPGTWQPALLQPRCDVTVRYQAVRAGGGCSLEIQLSPVFLLCNAAPITLTLRAHDAAPLCKLEPGSAISLPSGVLKKPFFMSVEIGRETFVSGQLELSNTEPGRYGAPPPGKLAVDHSADFAILCNQKVAFLTMYYEIKEEINVLGASSTYVILNRLDENILVSAVTMAADLETNIVLRNTAYKVIPPTRPDSVHGTPLCRFWLRGRWRGSCPSELRSYICLALPCRSGPSNLVPPAQDPVPIRLATGSMSRRAVALIDSENKSIPVVVTQMKQDGRYLISVARDPCPQFVVHNRSRTPLSIAQPVLCRDEPSTSHTIAERECEGTRWWCSVPPGASAHYSTPAHCARYPPPAMPRVPQLPFITFAKSKEEGEPNWCPAVVAADGEQLLQLQGGITVKLRVRTNPHSTLLELQDVDHTDISASDIRRRLYGPFSSESQFNSLPAAVGPSSSKRLERVGADEKLIQVRSEPSASIDPDLIPGQEKDRRRGPRTASIDDDIKPLPLGVPTSSGELGIIKNPTKSSLEMEESESNDELPVLETQEDRKQRASLSADAKEAEQENLNRPDIASSDSSFVFHDLHYSDWNNGESWPPADRARCVVDAVVVEVAATADARPLLALHADRVALHVLSHHKRTRTTLTISDVQIDNLQYESGQFDFGVVASTRNERLPADRWPPVWNIFADRESFHTRRRDARLLLILQHDRWTVAGHSYNELTEVEMSLGPLALYVEDAYVSALASLWRLAAPPAPLSDAECTLADERILQRPLRLRSLHLRPLDLTLTLHTAVRMYIALDQSPLRLTAFRLQDMMTSPERLTHALTVHYLSAAILGAGWVVGGLELLGAPGALAARLGEASGGVRGIVSAAAAALLRSLSAWAGSLARNLDLLAGDEEHAQRAAAARRRPPQTFMAGLAAGITNFAINILGAVGGLAHHPLVGVAVGETESGAAALRRGLVGALAKPLSATADLVAYAGHGLLSQTGWDPIPQPREVERERSERGQACWRRDCVRWCFRLCELDAVSGFEVLLENAPLQLLFTHKFLVVADPGSERIVEMIDFRFCSVGPYQGAIIELSVSQRRTAKVPEQRAPDEDDEYQITAAAMARVARYTGAESGAGADARVLALMAAPARAHALYAALLAAIHHNADTHFCLL